MPTHRKVILHGKYFGISIKLTNIVVFAILCAIEQTEFHISSTNIAEVSLFSPNITEMSIFGYIIQSFYLHCQVGQAGKNL